MMKVPKGTSELGGHDSVYDLWTSNRTLNEKEGDNAMAVLPGISFKSKDVVEWNNRTIKLVCEMLKHFISIFVFLCYPKSFC